MDALDGNRSDDTEELIVLVSDDGVPFGTIPKSQVHNATTPLHLAFSVFLFNRDCELLLQQRAFTKKAWPGIWSNSCCGHPIPGESITDAAKRRLRYELGIEGAELQIVLPDFRYRAEKDGVVENEICPVLVGSTDAGPQINPDEVASIKLVPWEAAFAMIKRPEEGFSPWAKMEVELLEKNVDFQTFISGLAAGR